MTSLLLLLFAFVISNFYRAMLNANYVTKGGYDTAWRRLDQLQNFTLFFTVSDKLVRSRNEYKSFMGGKHVTKFQLYRSACLSKNAEEVDGAFCRLVAYVQRVRDALVYDPGCRSVLHKILGEQQLFGHDNKISCSQQDVKILENIARNSRFIHEADVSNAVTAMLDNKWTALVTTEEYFPAVWKHFKTAMRSHWKLRFAHNYHAPFDNTIPKSESRIIIGSGIVEKSFTRLITSKAHVMRCNVLDCGISGFEWSRGNVRTLPYTRPVLVFLNRSWHLCLSEMIEFT